MGQNLLRRRILELLYKEAVETGEINILRGKYLNELKDPNLTKESYLFAVKYLESKSFIKVTWYVNDGIGAYSLTENGIDLIENESEFNIKFPISQTVVTGNYNIVGNNNYMSIIENNITQSELPAELKTQVLDALSEINKQPSADTKSEVFKKFANSAFKNVGAPILVELIKSFMLQ